jgi:hypothetical protein
MAGKAANSPSVSLSGLPRYVAACLDVLVDFYAGPERHERIRMAEIEPPGEREAAD